MKKYKILKVTKVEQYIIPMIDDNRTEINGWKMEGVVKDWFEDYPADSYHATRNGHSIFGGSYYEKAEILDKVEERPKKKNLLNEGDKNEKFN